MCGQCVYMRGSRFYCRVPSFRQTIDRFMFPEFLLTRQRSRVDHCLPQLCRCHAQCAMHLNKLAQTHRTLACRSTTWGMIWTTATMNSSARSETAHRIEGQPRGAASHHHDATGHLGPESSQGVSGGSQERESRQVCQQAWRIVEGVGPRLERVIAMPATMHFLRALAWAEGQTEVIDAQTIAGICWNDVNVT